MQFQSDGPIHTLWQEQLLNTDVHTLWNFISHPHNLNQITPESLHFEILSQNLPEQIYTGLLLKYRIQIPLIGKQYWVTEIKTVEPDHQFIDEQRLGPYKFWYHQHTLKQAGNQVLMQDHITYILPWFSVFPSLLNQLVIKNQLASIFNFRMQKFAELFGTPA